MKMRTVLAAISLTATVWVTALPLEAATFSGSEMVGGYTHSARATFQVDGPYLNLLLENTGAQVQDPGQVLTCVFFDLAGSPAITPHAVALAPASDVVNNNVVTAPALYNLDREWAFRSDLGDNQWGNAQYGAGAVGLSGLFGPGDIFAGHVNGRPDGIDYGIVPVDGTASQGGLNGRDFVRGGVLLQFGLPDGYVLDDSSVSNVWFQYGTSPSETSVQTVPEPCSLGALGLGALALLRRRRRA